MKSLEEQIADRCIHFTGIGQTAVCKAGVFYDDVKDTSVRPYTWPCLKNFWGLTGSSGLPCDKCQFPTPEEVAAEIKIIKTL